MAVVGGCEIFWYIYLVVGGFFDGRICSINSPTSIIVSIVSLDFLSCQRIQVVNQFFPVRSSV